MSAVDFYDLCILTVPENRRSNLATCEYMQSIDYQIDLAIKFQSERDWVEIAYTPADVRRINNEGKMAMILSIEVSDLFRYSNGDLNWREKLYYYHAKGVRSIQIVHQVQNRFASPAIHNAIFSFLQCFRPEGCFVEDENGFNMKG